MNTRIPTVVAMGLREFRRTPVLLGLLVVLPMYFIGGFMYIMPTTTLPVSIAGERVTVEMASFFAALMTPITAGLLSGIVGLFLMHTSAEADDRLRLAGVRSSELVLSRVSLLGIGGLLVSGASLAVVLVGFTPASIPGFVAGTVMAALTYGILGVIVGVLLDRLSGVYVMLFTPTVDMLLFQNPLATNPPSWVEFLPGYFVTKATMDAAFAPGVDGGYFVGGIGYLLILVVVGTAVFYRVMTVN
ncbi:hypothetical protein [Halolamina sp. C58]|uniref:hypothetical protein n=1 Tax=Halolamina sp. C58 TaxID=3421640 RepID=UPI003EB8C5E4